MRAMRAGIGAEAVYEYLRATIDVGQQRLSLFLDNKKIDEHLYRLR